VNILAALKGPPLSLADLSALAQNESASAARFPRTPTARDSPAKEMREHAR